MKKIVVILSLLISACSSQPPKIPLNSVDIIEDKYPPQIAESYPLPELPKNISSNNSNTNNQNYQQQIKIDAAPIESENEIDIQ